MEASKLIRRKELLGLIGVSCATQWRLEKAGLFPARVQLGKSSVAWHLSEVEEWIMGRQRVEGRRAGPWAQGKPGRPYGGGNGRKVS
jgi:prophage regulatory protein